MKSGIGRRDLARYAAALLLPAGCGGAASGAGARAIVVRGSDTMTVLLRRWAAAYDGAPIDVSGGGTGTGIAALANGTADAASASRRMTDAELQTVRARVGPVEESIVAIDAVAIYAHAQSLLPSISLDELARVYRGEVDRWSELGAGDHAIARYSRENSSGTYAFFRERVLHDGSFAPDVQCLPGTSAVVRAVSRDRWALGYGGIASAEGGRVRVLALRSDDGRLLRPERDVVKVGAYPLARPVYVYHPRNARPSVLAFVRWLRSEPAQRLAIDAGFFAAEEPSS